MAHGSDLTHPRRSWQKRRTMHLLWLALLAAQPVADAAAQPPYPAIHVKIANLRNGTGNIACALFDSSSGFPIDYLVGASHLAGMKIRNSQPYCEFTRVPAGTYAITIMHDENMNGRLDANTFGIPVEGYGFSNDARGRLGAPSFSAASFRYDGGPLDLSISMRY